MNLIDSLIQRGWLKTPRIIDAFKKIRRMDFLPDDMKGLAELNEALPIGFNQTISQPLVVAFMLELLQPEAGDKILDIGSGSGWTSGLLGQIVGETGKVIAIELVTELKKFGEDNVSKYNFVKKGIVEFICADGSKGYPNYNSHSEFAEGPKVLSFAEGFDKILASASAEKLPEVWKKQLKIEGRIVMPIGNSIWLFIKKSSSSAEEDFEKIEYPGFVFVPLIEN